MKKRVIIFPIILLLINLTLSLHGEDNGISRIKEIRGVWRGTSTCIKSKGNEDCNDEVVVYTIFQSSNDKDKVTLKADKIVNRIPQTMYDMDFSFNAKSNMWESEFKNERVHILWSFSVKGKQMIGTLRDIPSGVIRRNVSVTKD